MKKLTYCKLVFGLGVAVLAGSLADPCHAAEPEQATSTYDGHRYIKDSVEEKVSAPHEVERTPLFDNVPFLKLRTGDKLMKGKQWFGLLKGEDEQYAPTESYFLLSNETYYKLDSVREQDGKLILGNGILSLLFDWDVTLANATSLQELERSKEGEALTLASLPKLKEALRKDFPESLRPSGDITITAPHLEGEGKARHAVFEGLGFERRSNTVFKYQLYIGNDIYMLNRRDLIIGPRRVERWEFEGLKGGGLNGTGPYTPDPETAAKARTDYDRMIAFQNIVNKFLAAPRPEEK